MCVCVHACVCLCSVQRIGSVNRKFYWPTAVDPWKMGSAIRSLVPLQSFSCRMDCSLALPCPPSSPHLALPCLPLSSPPSFPILACLSPVHSASFPCLHIHIRMLSGPITYWTFWKFVNGRVSPARRRVNQGKLSAGIFHPDAKMPKSLSMPQSTFRTFTCRRRRRRRRRRAEIRAIDRVSAGTAER